MEHLKVRLSPSKLEQFRKYFDEEMFGFITKDKVLDYFRGTATFQRHVDIGTAYHALIEDGPEEYWCSDKKCFVYDKDKSVDPVHITVNEAKPGLAYRDKYPGIVHECPAEITIQVGKYEVLIPMKIDGIRGIGLHEVKTKHSALGGVEDYERSIQWKIYLLATSAKFLQYDIFTILKKAKDVENTVTLNSFRFYPYPGLLSEITNIVGLTIKFCEENDLIERIRQK